MHTNMTHLQHTVSHACIHPSPVNQPPHSPIHPTVRHSPPRHSSQSHRGIPPRRPRHARSPQLLGRAVAPFHSPGIVYRPSERVAGRFRDATVALTVTRCIRSRSYARCTYRVNSPNLPRARSCPASVSCRRFTQRPQPPRTRRDICMTPLPTGRTYVCSKPHRHARSSCGSICTYSVSFKNILPATFRPTAVPSCEKLRCSSSRHVCYKAVHSPAWTAPVVQTARFLCAPSPRAVPAKPCATSQSKPLQSAAIRCALYVDRNDTLHAYPCRSMQHNGRNLPFPYCLLYSCACISPPIFSN